MATLADVAAYRSAQRDVVTLAVADLSRWWGRLTAGLTGDAPVAQMEAFTAGLVATYGDAAALAAADWYDDLRASAGVRGRFRARMADPASAEQAAAVARWAAGPLFGSRPEPHTVLTNLTGAVQRLVMRPARETIEASVDLDPADARWARVPGGDDPCAFCRLLASRGAAYHSEETAGGLANSYHNECWCVPTPLWRGQQEPYDVDGLLEQYNDARAAAGGNPKAILAQLREDLGVN